MRSSSSSVTGAAVMNADALPGLRTRYAIALASYMGLPGEESPVSVQPSGRVAISGGDEAFESEAALSEAYELGRATVHAGMGVLEMTNLHHEVLCSLAGDHLQRLQAAQLERAGTFLSEGLSAFEMMLSGYRESNARLVAMNEALSEATLAAESASRAKSMFVATVSHELRTPMNGVIGMLDVLAHSRLSQDQAEAVRTIRDSGFALLRIIDDILDFSKIDANRMQLECVPVAVAEMTEGLCVALATVAFGKDVDLHVFAAPDVPEWLGADPVRLRQVLSNLIGNAIKFSAGRPRVRGRVAVRLTVLAGPPQRLCISVSDNGIGMAPATLATLFEAPYTQGEAATTRRYGGTGLGLVICKRLLDLMGGDIRVESEPGVGTTITVSIALEGVDGVSRTFASLAGAGCIIVADPFLCVDDLRAYLEAAGATVVLADNMEHALQQAEGVLHVVVIQAVNGDCAETAQTALRVAPLLRHVLVCRDPGGAASIAGVVTLAGPALRRSALLRAVAAALGRVSPEVVYDLTGLDQAWCDIPVPSVEEEREAGRLILIAEDEATNQKVLLLQLGLLGYAADIGANGAEALRLWRAGRYALLITDLHMPEMDGYTLAETIRREEAGERRIPILALTANALREEASHVFAIGMDEYLTKPIQLHELRVALGKWLQPEGACQPAGPLPVAAETAAPDAAVDLTALIQLVGNNPTALHELLTQYLESVQRLPAELHLAYSGHRWPGVAAAAHALRSPSFSFGAKALAYFCEELERAGFAGDQAKLDQLMPQFDPLVAAVEAALGELLAGLAGQQMELR